MHTYLYSVYSYCLSSNIALSWPQPVRSDSVDISFLWRPEQPSWNGELTWHHRWQDSDGVDWLVAARTGNGYLLRLIGLADFSLSLDGREIRGAPLGGFDPHLLDPLLINHILPFALTLQGRLAFHASASCVSNRAVLFLGDAGSGKSTLAAYLFAQGFPVLADDCAVLNAAAGKLWVLPSHPTLRLWPHVKDAVSRLSNRGFLQDGKFTVSLRSTSGFWTHPTLLDRLFILAPSRDPLNTPALVPVRGPEGVIELVRNSFRIDLCDRLLLTRQLETFSKLIDSIPVEQLRLTPTPEGLRRASNLVISRIAT